MCPYHLVSMRTPFPLVPDIPRARGLSSSMNTATLGSLSSSMNTATLGTRTCVELFLWVLIVNEYCYPFDVANSLLIIFNFTNLFLAEFVIYDTNQVMIFVVLFIHCYEYSFNCNYCVEGLRMVLQFTCFVLRAMGVGLNHT